MSAHIYLATHCICNPGLGAYCALIVSPDGTERLLVGAPSYTTEEQLTLLAALRGLGDFHTPAKLQIVSSSRYLVDGVRKRSSEKRKPGPKESLEERFWTHILDLSVGHEITWNFLQASEVNVHYERAVQAAYEAATQAQARRTGLHEGIVSSDTTKRSAPEITDFVECLNDDPCAVISFEETRVTSKAQT